MGRREAEGSEFDLFPQVGKELASPKRLGLADLQVQQFTTSDAT